MPYQPCVICPKCRTIVMIIDTECKQKGAMKRLQGSYKLLCPDCGNQSKIPYDEMGYREIDKKAAEKCTVHIDV